MSSAKKTLNPLTETPSNKVEVTKPFMLSYLKSGLADPDKVKQFKKFVAKKENQKEYINRLTNEPYTDINIPVVRKEFCRLFFPQLLEKKKSGGTFIEEIDNL